MRQRTQYTSWRLMIPVFIRFLIVSVWRKNHRHISQTRHFPYLWTLPFVPIVTVLSLARFSLWIFILERRLPYISRNQWACFDTRVLMFLSRPSKLLLWYSVIYSQTIIIRIPNYKEWYIGRKNFLNNLQCLKKIIIGYKCSISFGILALKLMWFMVGITIFIEVVTYTITMNFTLLIIVF